ncbi:MAG: luciferase [Actinomycetia bacterium]|nr:luciferase [Actinomycetes bacterium]
MDLGYQLSSEEMAPTEMVRRALEAEVAGFERLTISDHFHPWVDRQGQSPFVWSVVGAIAAVTDRMKVGTAVTCPTMRMHPAIIAQAAATSAAMLPGRFFLGVGSGEALNEHILGDRWPQTDVRLEMLEEAVEVIRLLLQGGDRSHHGKHYTVENARLYTLPEQPVPIMVSAFGPKAARLAGRIGDGYVGTAPEAELLETFDRAGGAGKPKIGGMKCCWGTDKEAAEKLAFELWPTTGLSGELSQVLPTPAHFEQACTTLRQEDVTGTIPCGPDVGPYLDSLRQYRDAGYTELYIQQIGPDQEGFFRFYERELQPAFAQSSVPVGR